MKTIFQDIRKILEEDKEAAVVTIVENNGSSPRKAGSRMAVRKNGTTVGTVGGGEVEYRAIQAAGEAIRKQKSGFSSFRLNQGTEGSLNMVCGGNVTMYFQYMEAEDGKSTEFCKRAEEAVKKGGECWLILRAFENGTWQMDVTEQPLKETGKAGLVQGLSEEEKVYQEPLILPGRVYVFGAGHVARELVPVLQKTGFSCTVFDDRQEFACCESFPDADRIVVGDFSHISDYVEIGKNDYVCIMSRGHQYDYLVQKQLIASPARYMGVMGSRRKKAVISGKLLYDGFTKEQIDRFKTPIGLDIGAETPEEIAVSIAAELIRERALRGKREHSCPESPL